MQNSSYKEVNLKQMEKEDHVTFRCQSGIGQNERTEDQVKDVRSKSIRRENGTRQLPIGNDRTRGKL